MPTGACGINCDVCQLRLLGLCSSCGAGASREAEGKLEAQNRLLGAPCPILACAQMNRIGYCLRDCASFPCDTFSTGPYPFSRGFLAMQERRRGLPPATYAPDGSHVAVDPGYWQQLADADLSLLCNRTGFDLLPGGRLGFRFLEAEVQVDPGARCIRRLQAGNWVRAEDPLLELVTVLYLIRVKDIHPLGRDLVGPKDLKEGHFFQGPHALKIDPLLERYGEDIRGFRQASEALGGEPLQMAEAAYCLKPFPRIYLYYLLWAKDDEFPARVSILFDRPIEETLAADAIWALVNRVSTALLKGKA
jgi:hypothetical protein